MLRTYKYNGKLWRYEEGEQPAGAVEVCFDVPNMETPEKRAEKAPAKRKKAKEAEQA